MNVVQWVCDDLQNTGIQAQTSTAVTPTARRLEWVVNADVRDTIQKMQAENRQRGEQLHLRVIRFQEFGKTAIKGLKISPDAFFHLAVQLAWFRMNGRLASTYEAVAMRHFHQGRTECARPCTSQALAFVSACGDSPVGNAAHAQEAAQLIRAAAEQHMKMLNDCQLAQGPERHLFGLQEMMKRTGEELPKKEDLFSSAGYQVLKHDTLSTSGLAAEHVGAFCFGPVVSDGFGIGYGICGENIRLAISCFEENKDRLDLFVEGIERALRDLMKILQYTE
jgi:carnitine O-acetyltransferase